MPAASVVARIISGGEVVGKWVKVGDMVQSWHTCVVNPVDWTKYKISMVAMPCYQYIVYYVYYRYLLIKFLYANT